MQQGADYTIFHPGSGEEKAKSKCKEQNDNVNIKMRRGSGREKNEVLRMKDEVGGRAGRRWSPGEEEVVKIAEAAEKEGENAEGAEK